MKSPNRMKIFLLPKISDNLPTIIPEENATKAYNVAAIAISSSFNPIRTAHRGTNVKTERVDRLIRKFMLFSFDISVNDVKDLLINFHH